MKRLIFLLGLIVAAGDVAKAQAPNPPDCVLNFSFTASGVSGDFKNTTVGCVTWTVNYQATSTGTISSLSLAFQSANGAVTPGSFGSYAGTTSTGANPATNTTGEISTFANGTQIISWVRMSLTLSATGSTTVNGVLYGYRTGNSGGGGGGGSGCTGTVATPCQIGVDNAGTSLPALGDATGKILNGAYPTIAAVALSNSGLTSIIAHSASLTTTVAHYSVSFASLVSFQLEYGTGTNCGTGTTALTGVYQPLLAIAIDTPFIVPAGKDLCVNLGSSITGGGAIVYSQP